MTKQRDGLSLGRYLAIFYLIWVSYFLGVIMLLGGPVAAGANPKDLVWQLPLSPLAAMGFQYRFALKTPEEERENFWSYKISNLAFVGIVILTLIIIATLD